MTKSIKPDFFIMGEMVHGDYSKMIEETGIDSVSNYECYKGLYSSLNDVNYHEIAYSFNRLFGPWGLNHNHNLYNFVDNHDVNRVASTLVNQADLYPLYIMLYTMKGYTSIYYKSEIGVKGVRSPYSDDALRPTYDVTELSGCEKQPLYNCVKRLADIRKNHEGLCYGEHKTLLVESDLIAYKRTTKESAYVIIINNSNNTRIISEKEIGGYPIKGYDLLNQEDVIQERINIYPNWGKIIELNHIAN
jgi:cyclomaltodextrinase